MNFNRLGLRRLILSLASISVLLTLFSALHATYNVQRDLLIENTLKSNQAYASKLAQSTDMHIKSVTSLLDWSAQTIAKNNDLKSISDSETKRLFSQINAFYLVMNFDENLSLVSIAQDTRTCCIVEKIKQNPEFKRSLDFKTKFVSSPFTLENSNYLVMLTSPIIDDSGVYKGFIAGIIDLQKESAIKHLLSDHHYQDETYLYVVDQHHRLIVHADPLRVGELIKQNTAINTVLNGEVGNQITTNSLGIKMLAGYAPIESVNWGVVAQKSLDETLKSLNVQMLNILLHSLPLLLLTGLLVWYFASQISKPLWSLAYHAENLDSKKQMVGIKAWYYEAYELKDALLKGMHFANNQINQLQNESFTDPLTGLFNRRGMQQQLDTLVAKNVQFSIILLDIDFFKSVNDTYGHDVGDEVIKSTAQLMRECSREQDFLIRFGGEEFLIILPEISIEQAEHVAERLRQKMGETNLDKVGYITISLGVTHWPSTAETVEECLKLADVALYQAKQTGRNKVVVLQTNPDVS